MIKFINKISVIVPVLNEANNIPIFIKRVVPILKKIGSYKIIFCLDPSNDGSEVVITKLIKSNLNIGLITFSRKFGQPNAIMAGIQNSNSETIVIIDVDLQDPPELIAQLYKKLNEGYDVVYAKRKTRKGETFSKIFTAWLGYKIINKISEVKIPKNVGDFRIIGSRIIENLKNMPENDAFLRGLVAYIGFKQTFILYDRDERLNDRSKYNAYFGSMKIGFNGLIGFSNFLLSFILLTGIFIFLLATFASLYIVYSWVIGTQYPTGIPTAIITTLLMGGIQLIAIGILGEYIGRIYNEVKKRPSYIIDKKINL
jgi:glycosyltransferase involved in cell wall biosynthesis